MDGASRAGGDFLAAYGTLRSAANAAALVGRPLPAVAGTVAGWAVVALAGRPYPGAVRAAGASADVSVLGPVTPAELALVDAWEDEYERERVCATLADGTRVDVWLWALRPDDDPALQPAGLWRLGAWEREYLPRSVRAAAAFRRARAGGARPPVPHDV